MKLRIKWNTLIILLILLLEIIILSILTPTFFTFSILLSIANQISVTGIVAVGMIFVLIAGSIDLSVGSQMALSGIISAWLMVNLGVNSWIAVLLCILICVILGIINGFITSKLNIHPFIITIAASTIYRGISKTINSGMPVYGLSDKFLNFTRITIFTIPLPVIILMLCIVIGIFILNKTYIGKYFFAIGGDEKVAELAGLNTGNIKVLVYSLCGFFTGIASIISLSRIGSAQPLVSTGIELDVLAAAALGGISFKGGKGSIINIVIGVFIMGILGSGLIMLNVGEYFRNITKGVILLIAIGIDKSTHTS